MKPAAMVAPAQERAPPQPQVHPQTQMQPRPPGPLAPWWQRVSERWCNWRDRTVGRASFQHWAAGFVLTRPLARQRARGLFDIVAGFVYTQVLLACVRLDLFERLAADGPQTVATLAQAEG